MRRLRHVLVSLMLAAASSVGLAGTTEPVACLVDDPAQWPAASKPYFLVIADTSSSMTTAVGSASSCGYGSTRNAHARCALQRMFQAYDGVAQFGLATYPMQQTSCSGACFSGCTYTHFASEFSSRGTNTGCGPLLGAGASTASAALIRVGVAPDDFWATPPSAPNSNSLLGWVDNSCSSNTELFSSGATPLNGSLRDARRYFLGTYVQQDGVTALPSPLSAFDYAGAGVNGGTGCRSLNVILLTDGDESCDTQADAIAAATALYGTGVSIGGRTYKIRVHVINFAGGTIVSANEIANAGGTGTAYIALNETDLTTALTTIVTGSLRAEVPDNADNNCSSCSDEGFPHYRNTNPVCCAWATTPQRTTCMNNFMVSITPANPQGNRNLLPCTTSAQASDPSTWLLHNPGDACDNLDNNGDGAIDEGQVKCGFPPACPSAEVCDARDNNCNGVIDEGCPGILTVSAEICDSCDNDADGQTDDGIAPVPCGLPSPPNCIGVMTCKPGQVVPAGSCAAGGGYNACSFNPMAETCDNIDNNCNGIVDDGVASAACVPAGTPGGLTYGGTSQCRMGGTLCSNGSTQCRGFIGPTPEVCDGTDNDCDGQIDDAYVGANSDCGVLPGLIYNQAPSQCRSGLIACNAGSQTCQGAVGPSSEILGDGIDNNCNGLLDENDIFGNGFE